MKKKQLIIVLSSFFMIFGLSTSVGLAEVWKWPKDIKILVPGGMTSGAYVGTIAWSSVMEKETGMNIRVVPETVLNKRCRDVKYGKALFTRDGMQAISRQIEAPDNFAVRDPGPFQVRLGWISGETWLVFMVRADSDIKSIKDIKPGIRWPSLPGEPPYQNSFRAMFAWAQVDPEKEAVPVVFSEWGHAIKALAEGKVDIAFSVASWPAVYEVAAGPHGIRVLEMDPKKDSEGAKRFWDKKPTMGFSKIKFGEPSTVGVTSPAVLSIFATRAETDQELMYQFCTWMDKNFDKYKEKNEGCKLMSPEVLNDWMQYIFVPLHDGTIKYLKEKGWWNEETEKRQKRNVNLVTKYVEAYKIAIAKADKNGIKVEPKNAEWQKLWSAEKKAIPQFTLNPDF